MLIYNNLTLTVRWQFLSHQWEAIAELILKWLCNACMLDMGCRGKPFLEIQGVYRKPWAGVKKPSMFLALSCVVVLMFAFSLLMSRLAGFEVLIHSITKIRLSQNL